MWLPLKIYRTTNINGRHIYLHSVPPNVSLNASAGQHIKSHEEVISMCPRGFPNSYLSKTCNICSMLVKYVLAESKTLFTVHENAKFSIKGLTYVLIGRNTRLQRQSNGQNPLIYRIGLLPDLSNMYIGQWIKMT